MAAMAKRVTSQDVAVEAGVSRATVSYVLNGVTNQPITDATRDRVLDAARRLGYRPNAAARMLKTGQSDILLQVVPPWTPGPIMQMGMAWFVERSTALGYTPLLYFGHGAPDGALADAVDRLQPVGVVAPGPVLTPSFVAHLRANGTKAVLAIDSSPRRGVPTVVIDNRSIGELAVSHLAERGRRHVLAVLPVDPALADLAAARLAGARAQAEQMGVRLSTIQMPLQLDAAAGVLTEEFRPRRGRPDSVFAYNDEHACVVERLLLDADVSVPDEVAIIGCDNLPMAELMRPALTSLQFDVGSGTTSFTDALHDIIQGRRVPMTLPFGTPVVVQRAST
jgi:DNA-binding LacI/PurR family transcriptional regulator